MKRNTDPKERVFQDARFSKFYTAKRFRTGPRKNVRTVVDTRFRKMLESEDFSKVAAFDKSGRVTKHQNHLNDLYQIEGEQNDSSLPDNNDKESDEEVENEEPRNYVLKPDESITSSDTSSDSDEESDPEPEAQPQLEEADSATTTTATTNLAIMDVRWDIIRPEDLWMVCSSFVPPTGFIKSVKIYVSDFGKKALENELIHGPPVFNSGKNPGLNLKKLRAYEDRKRRYYFAVVECSDVACASAIYDNVNNYEIGGHSRADVRYVPDDVMQEVSQREVHTECLQEPGKAVYHKMGEKIATVDVGDLNVKEKDLGWDKTDPWRLQLTQRRYTKDEINENDFKAYLASSDSEDSSVGSQDKEERKNKMRSLISSLKQEEVKNSKEVCGEMEVTFSSGLENKLESLIKEKLTGPEEPKTPFEQLIEKRAEKKREKKKLKKLKEIEDKKSEQEETPLIEDHSLEEEDEQIKAQKKKTKKKDKKEKLKPLTEDQKRANEELSLLLMDPAQAPSSSPLSTPARLSKKAKKKVLQQDQQETTKAVESIAQDHRFDPLFTDSRFARDPTSNHFDPKNTANKLILQEKHRRVLPNTPAPDTDKKGDDIAKMMARIKSNQSKLNQ
uniref:ESF1 RRM domain-containing protein n=1 Tax=Arcella intermedia TaxID=1963864 RepID=A0A6B2L024_9EUKA